MLKLNYTYKANNGAVINTNSLNSFVTNNSFAGESPARDSP
jgi:hypothetical protein